MASLPQICGLLPPPERNDALNAVAKTIGLIRRRRFMKPAEIAKALKQDDGKAPHVDTIARAERGETLLSFDLIVQLAYLYDDCAEPLRMLMEPAIQETPETLQQRFVRIERDLDAIRKEMAA